MLLIALLPALLLLSWYFNFIRSSTVSQLERDSTHMLDSVEDYWDVAHIMVKGCFAATKYNRENDGGEEQSLEQLFFSITEGQPEAGQ